ncbi:MAG: PLP-dependent aminotransferase family protein [Alphaproteobacteria bacterium]|nr:PLP-dependent aminotransferase family protein [Alphaproteobacteria bacterium]
MQLPIVVSEVGSSTLQDQIFEQIRAMILDGQLKAEDPLPATRDLSAQAGVSRNTAVLAYERLIAEGYLYTRPHVGTFVASEIPEDALSVLRNGHEPGAIEHRLPRTPCPSIRLQHPRDAHQLVSPHGSRLTADFWVGRPDPASFPTKAWSKHIWRRLQSAGTGLTEYGNPAGLLELRQAIADHLGPARGIIADPDQIIIVGGCQDGFNLISRLLIEQGTPAIVENPCYQGAAYVLQCHGATLHPVPVDREGLDVSQLPGMRRAVVYITPSHQYPMGVTLSLPRRITLLSWATENDAYIIEDDYDSDFRFVGSPLTALKGLDRRDRVLYLGTFSKCMGPGLRLGYIVVPPPLSDVAKRLKALMSNGQAWLEQAAMADFMSSGGYQRHLRRVRQLYLEKRDALIAALDENFGPGTVSGADGGMHLVCRIPDGLPNVDEIERRALSKGIGVCSFSSGAALYFGDDDGQRRHLVLGYAALTPKQIKKSISQLAGLLSPNSHAPKMVASSAASEAEA